MNSNKYIIILLALFLAACSSTHTLDKRVTQDNFKTVSINAAYEADLQEPIRFWPDQKLDFLYSENHGTTPLKVKGDQLNILALSGGGANGAFGAGIVNGLHDSGQLKQYTVVTGISAGSLIAPFVFTGGDDIPRLKKVILGINDKMVLGKRNFLNALLKDAFTDGEKLFEFIEEVYTPEMIERIAQQHQEGRRLFIGTSHFDSNDLVIWNVGQIAQSNLPNKARLIHQILAASSSMPGVFPPQFIEVEYQGKKYEELHVDGGMAAQMFFQPGNLEYSKISKALGLTKPPQVDIIRNGVLKMPYTVVPDKGVALLSRSVASMVVQQSRGDLYRMLYFSEADNLDLSFTYIDDTFVAKKTSKDMFDLDYMIALFKFAYDKAAQGDLWSKEIPL
jgi:hypothetical protein